MWEKKKERREKNVRYFNYADQNYIDAAIYEMNAANEKFRAMLKEKRRGVNENMGND